MAEALDNLYHAIVLKDRDSRFTYANRECLKLLGRNRSDVVGHCDYDLFPPKLAEKYRRDDLTVLGSGQPLEDIEQLEAADGTVIHIKVIKSPIRSGGCIVGVQAEFWDITDQVTAERSAEASDERLRLFLEHNPVPSWLFDDGMTLRHCNEAFATLLDQPVDQVLGRKCEEFLPANFPPEMPETHQGDPLSGEPSQTLTTMTRLDGSTAHYLIIRFPCRGENGETWTGGMALDISERAQAEHALRESESRLRLLADASGDAIWDHQIGKGPLWRNRAFLELLGLPNHDGPTTTDWWESQIVPDQREKVARSFRAAIASPEVTRWIQDYKMIGRAGTPLFLHEIVYISRNSAGEAARLIGSIRDITGLEEERERKEERESQLRETQKLESLGVLAGGIAHDFNNLLTSILGNLDLAINSLDEDSDEAGLLRDVEQSSLRAADLCQQMLAYSGKGKFEVRRVQVSDFIREMDRLLALSVSKKSMLQFELVAEKDTVEADLTQLQQVIMNLVINASESLGGQTGTINVSTALEDVSATELSEFYRAANLSPGPYVRLEVRDTGAGMDEETLQRIFEPFFTTKFTGRGLGLAAVVGIVRGHGGAVRVLSELGKGTTFRIILPLCQGCAETAAVADEHPSLPGSGKVLIVDDEPLVRKTAARILERAGYEVELAIDGEQGVRRFQNAAGEIDLVLMDLTMPRMDGVEACAQMRTSGSTTPVLVMSGYSEQDTVRKFAEGSVAGFLQKPFQPEHLLGQVKRILEDSAL